MGSSTSSTKDPVEGTQLGGTLSSSLGERGTGDYRGEVSGTLGRFGYYISGGKLTSAGLLPHNGVDENNIYTKFNWDIPGKGGLALTLGYNESLFQGGQFTAFGVSASPQFDTRDIYSTLALKYALGDSLDLELTGRSRTQDADIVMNAQTGMGRQLGDEYSYGVSAKLVWRQRWQAWSSARISTTAGSAATISTRPCHCPGRSTSGGYSSMILWRLVLSP